MPTFHGDDLHRIASRVLQGAGVSPEDASIIAEELKEANLVGHDSHGVIRLMQYVECIDNGTFRPDGVVECISEGPSYAVFDANFNFGQVAVTKALDHGLALARTAGTATIMVRNCNHVGRLGSYSHRAALDGIASVMSVNSPGAGGVAPFGGIERRLGTNPISMAAPTPRGPLVLDMTTSTSAEGKLRVAFQKGETVPEGWIIDAEGNPTTEPAKFYADPPGSLLPLGGALGFKGSGMSMMIDVFAGILSGSGVCRDDVPRGANGVWMYFVDIEKLLPSDSYNEMLDRYYSHIKNCKKMPGYSEILMPGEIEQRRRQQRIEQGVDVADETWRQISELAQRLNVDLDH